MYPLEAQEWSDFAVGIAGAAAALAGLLFVAISINLQQILALPGLTSRAGLSLVQLAAPMFFAVAVLIPGQPSWALGVELLVIGVAIGPLLARLAGLRRRPAEQPVWSWVVSGVAPAALLTLGSLLAGISLVADLPGLGGLYWLPVGIASALVGALTNAWVLLVEIVR